jgi:hypothetical protein
MVPVDTQFILDPHHDQNHRGQTQSESKQIDQKGKPVFFETPESDFEIVGQHSGWRLVNKKNKTIKDH